MKKQQLAKRGKILLGWSVFEFIAGCLICFICTSMMSEVPPEFWLLSLGFLIVIYYAYAIFETLMMGLIAAGFFGILSGMFVIKVSREEAEAARKDLKFAMGCLVADAFGPFAVLLFVLPIQFSFAVLVRGLIIFFCFWGFWNFRNMKDEPEGEAKSLAYLRTSNKSEESEFTEAFQEGE